MVLSKSGLIVFEGLRKNDPERLSLIVLPDPFDFDSDA